MAYEPLHHKYRPQTFQDLVGQGAIATTLSNAIVQQRIAPAYLFSGPRGTGKTSSARILAKSLNCQAGDKPTPQPCGQCEACRSITAGVALDVIEIDAASNTGVDNIRELIEKAQFAPVQCRYKVYVIDECLTGDTQVITDIGVLNLNDPNIVGKKALSYNEISDSWEFKKIVRLLDQGTRQTYQVETNRSKIRCTGNHLIRTDAGWITAENLEEGMRILSPVNADVAPSSNMERTEESVDLSEVINSREVISGRSLAAATLSRSQSPRWHTNLETVSAVKVAGLEPVYDIEVEDNHNFVANGLLVHNCHMLSAAAFNALLKTLEEPPERVVFVLATTDPQRVLPTIISRCQRFDYRRIPLEDMVGHLHHIADQELIDIHDDALRLVAQLSQGGLRDAESLLDQLSLLPPPVAIEAVWDLVGAVPERELFAIAQAIAQNDAEAVIERARQLMDRGREPLVVLQNLASFYRDLLVAKTAAQRNDLVAITPGTWNEMTQFAQQLDVAVILQGQQHLRSSEIQLKNSTQPRLWLEVTLMGLLPAALVQPQAPSQVVAAATAPRISTTAPTPPTTASVLPPTAPAISPPMQVHAPPAPPTVVQSQAASPTEAPQAGSRPTEPAPPAANPTDVSTTIQPSSPTTPAPPVVNAVSASEAAASIDLAEMWKQVIANVEYRSTQMLLRQQSQLMRFTGAVAHIAVTQQWLSSIQTRQAAIEKAFARVAGSSIQIKLDAVAQKPEAPPPAAKSAGAPAPSPTSAPAKPMPSRPAPPRTSVPAPTPPAAPPPSPPLPVQPPPSPPEAAASPGPVAEADTAPPPAREPEMAPTAMPSTEPTASAATESAAIAQSAAASASITSAPSASPPFEEDEVEISIDPMAGLSPLPTLTAVSPSEAMAHAAPDAATEASQATLAPIGNAAAPTALKSIWDEDEIVRSAKQLAQFFNGEVVRDDIVTAELTPSSAEEEAVAIAPQPQPMELLPESSPEEDDDVPF